MREIKFRAWESANAKMRTWEELLSHLIIPGHSGWEWMQYTGLKDKNGKEIYEGDILKGNIGTRTVAFGEYDNHEDYADHDAGVGFYLEEGDKIDALDTLMLKVYNLKVIGNIYEKPELVK